MGPPQGQFRRNIALAALALLAAPSCRCDTRDSNSRVSAGPPVTSSQGFGVMAANGPEVWTIDGKPFQIRGTYFVVVGGRLQFTVDYLCADRCPELAGLSEDAAFAVAFPVMKYAVDNGLYSRTTVRSGTEPMKTELIGVAITQQVDGRERGYRVARTLEQVREAIRAGGPEATPRARP